MARPLAELLMLGYGPKHVCEVALRGIADIEHAYIGGSWAARYLGHNGEFPHDIDAAEKHLKSALAIADSDPDGSYALLYDAARKSLAAVLQTQGLRATSRGGHYAIPEAIAAQFTKPPPSDDFRSFGRLRRTRNQIEYDDISSVTAEDAVSGINDVRVVHATARQLITILPVFTD